MQICCDGSVDAGILDLDSDRELSDDIQHLEPQVEQA